MKLEGCFHQKVDTPKKEAIIGSPKTTEETDVAEIYLIE